MVREKTLSPSGEADDDGNYQNAQVSISQPELEYSGLEIGESVFVKAERGRIIIQSKEYEED